MMTIIITIYFIIASFYVGVSIGLGGIVMFFTGGSKDGEDLAGKIVLNGIFTALFWPVMIPYRAIQARSKK